MKNITASKWLSILFLVVSIMLCVACGKQQKEENNTYMDMNKYFGLENESDLEACVIIIDNVVSDMGIIKQDGSVYVPYSIVRKTINNKFYVDYEENLLIYSTPDKVYDSVIGTDAYTGDAEEKFEKIISFVKDEEVYVSLDYCMHMGKTVNYTVATEPNRLVITTILNNTVATVNEDARVRYQA